MRIYSQKIYLIYFDDRLNNLDDHRRLFGNITIYLFNKDPKIKLGCYSICIQRVSNCRHIKRISHSQKLNLVNSKILLGIVDLNKLLKSLKI